MPPKISVVGHPIMLARMEIAWKNPPEESWKEFYVQILSKEFVQKQYLLNHQFRHEYGGETSIRLAKWVDNHWVGVIQWPLFATIFSTDSLTIWLFGRFLYNNPYENLIIDHARQITNDTVERWFYVGQSGDSTHWATEPDGHPTLFHTFKE